jgi:hypothetical protein
MPSSRRGRTRRVAIATTLAMVGTGITYAPRAEAQQAVQGFALERFAPSAPGAGWFVMDDVSMHGGLGGAVSLSGGYAHDALRVTDGIDRLRVVSDQASFDVAMAVTYDRFRLYLDFTSPLIVKGDDSGGTATIGAYQLSPPLVDLGLRPDVIADPRIGFDARLFGEHDAPFRLGAGAQLYVPAGTRADYLTDGTYRAMLRVLVAGDLGRVSYAAHLGVHIRPLDDSPAPGSPQGSELLFGLAAGYRFPVDEAGHTVVVVGPEVYGESAFKSFLGTTSTGLEGLLTGRIEGTGDNGPQAQVKLGAGAGLNPHFGVPEWRFVLGVTLFDHHAGSAQSGQSGQRK